jgi:prophage regulatory protein
MSTLDPLVPSPAGYKLVGVSRSTGIAMVKDGLFPKPFRIGQRQTGWRQSEIEAVIRARVQGVDNDALRQLVADLHQLRKAA